MPQAQRNHETETSLTLKLALQQRFSVLSIFGIQPEQILVSHERKFFEYMAVGLPSICCDSKIYTDIIHQYQNGIAVDLNNAEAIAEALMRIFQSNQLNTYQQGAVKAAEEHYNWKSQENILLHLYQTI